MANIKWTGIESYKYGLTARWYVSAYYGNDIDVDGVGYYNPTTNVIGHGGPTRPFASLSKINQDVNILSGSIIVVDSGNYYNSVTYTKSLRYVGDGCVIFDKYTVTVNMYFYNITLTQFSMYTNTAGTFIDVNIIYSNGVGYYGAGVFLNSSFIECVIGGYSYFTGSITKCNFIKCSGTLFSDTAGFLSCGSNVIIDSPNLTIYTPLIRPAGVYIDYSIIIGTVKSNRSINGKITGVTIEDFKIDGKYFVKSFSEVNLFGNSSGSGASVSQLQTIFNNYFSPIYLDTWQDVDLSLKPNASDIIKYGGLNGTYVGALPVGYRYSAYDLYNTYIDSGNSSNIAWDAVNSAIVIATGQDVATYRSVRISLPVAITCDPINFFANLVYNIEGTAKQGVANQRIDTTQDLVPNNTLNQRVVYDFKLAYAPNTTDALSAFKNFELNRVPYIDNEGESMLDDNYDPAERQKPVIRDFMIEFNLRKIIIA